MLAIQNAKVLTVTNGIFESGTVLIDAGKIIDVGTNVAVPQNAEIYDASGKWITPGFIDAHTHISIKSEPATTPGTPDLSETTNPITPAVRAIDGVNPDDWAIPIVRAAGFTTICILPGSANLIGGQSVVCKTKPATTVYDMVVPGAPAQMKMALGENPLRFYGGSGKAPKTRLGNAQMLREILYKARNYADGLASGKVPSDFMLDALVPVVRGEMLCRIHCHRADDIVTVTRICEEYGLKYSLEHATEGWKILDYLKEKNITCVVGPLDIAKSKQELWNLRLETPGQMEKAGIDLCLTKDGRSGTRFLPYLIGMAIARGLSFETALRAVTINPAKLLGIDGQVGSIEVGKAADLAIFDGNPFSSFTLCEATVIDGQVYRADVEQK